MSTTWTLLLESFHSALLSELQVRLPEESIELDIPKRFSYWVGPDSEIRDGSVIAFNNAMQESGYVLLAVSSRLRMKKELEVESLSQKVSQKVLTHLSDKVENCHFEPPRELSLRHDDVAREWPEGFDEVSRLIWVPFRIGNEMIYLGLAA